jgi:hypothetical protein
VTPDLTGATGNLLMSGSLSAANMGMFRNLIINGAMQINQRSNAYTATAVASSGASSNTSGYYPADRWTAFRDSGCNAQMLYGTGLSTSDLPFVQAGVTSYARLIRPSGDTAVAQIHMCTLLESVNSGQLAGKAVTLSFYYRTGANFSSGATVTASVLSSTGTDLPYLGDAGAWTGQGSVSAAATSGAWSRASVTATMSTTTTQAMVLFTYATPSGAAGAQDFFDITGVQLEVGLFATPFERRPYPVELQVCQRYFFQLQCAATNYLAIAYCWNANNAFGLIPLPTAMRIAPYPALSSTSVFYIYGAQGVSTTSAIQSITLQNPSANNNSAMVGLGGFVSGTGTGITGWLGASSAAYISFSSEL